MIVINSTAVKAVKIFNILNDTHQYYVPVEKETYKLATIYDIYDAFNIPQAIIFVKSRRKALWLADKCKQYDDDGLINNVSVIHGDMHQKERELAAKEFRDGTTRVLVTTNFHFRFTWSRYNIDVKALLVINYDLPTWKEHYLYQIRGSKCVINFVTDDEEEKLKEIETFHDTQIDEIPLECDFIQELMNQKTDS